MKTYIWSDLHLSHANVIKYQDRPFSSVEEMNKTILNNWKTTVNKRDTIINLGDFCFKSNKSFIESVLKNTPGRKILIMGNHDKSRSLSWWLNVGFDEVYKYPIVYKNKYILSHEPVNLPNESYYINIHGHTHSIVFPGNRHNVCVENTNYMPILLDNIISNKYEEVFPILVDKIIK